eukprot:TRINITY_DN1187_c0_g2_i5.p1 TRINITY_DN1187_c0_g2~~TRINITY_DN1187_c0_g2_i5.p1  ORF type:complete len:303 (-),score=50.16 TRINITY_DN1187_c0_g2_i5:589-1389(-)
MVQHMGNHARKFLNIVDPRHVFYCLCGGPVFIACAAGCRRALCGDCKDKPCPWCHDTGTVVDYDAHVLPPTQSAIRSQLEHKELAGAADFPVKLQVLFSKLEDILWQSSKLNFHKELVPMVLPALFVALRFLLNKAVIQHLVPHDRKCEPGDPQLLDPATEEELLLVQQHFFCGMLENLPEAILFAPIPGLAMVSFTKDTGWILYLSHPTVKIAQQETQEFQPHIMLLLAVAMLHEFCHWKLHHYRSTVPFLLYSCPHSHRTPPQK